MWDILRPKAAPKKGDYTSEYFRNKVRISELEEQQKVVRQREQIKRMEARISKSKPQSQNKALRFLSGIGEGIQNYEAYENRMNKGRKKQKNMFGGGMF